MDGACCPRPIRGDLFTPDWLEADLSRPVGPGLSKRRPKDIAAMSHRLFDV